MRHSSLYAAYTQWAFKTRLKIKMRNVTSLAISQWRQNTIYASWNAWLALFRDLKDSVSSRYEVASQKCLRRQMMNAWSAWRSQADHHKKVQSIMIQAVSQARSFTTKMCFNSWKQEAHRVVILNFNLRQTLQRYAMSKTALVFSKWALQIRDDKNRRFKLRAILYKMLKGRLARAFNGWHENAKKIGLHRNLVSSAIARLRHQVNSGRKLFNGNTISCDYDEFLAQTCALVLIKLQRSNM